MQQRAVVLLMVASIVLALVTTILDLVVWAVKLIFLERWQFMDMIGGKRKVVIF